MWDVFLYICCLYWLMNKAALTYGRAKYRQAERDIEREQAESRRNHVAAKGERHLPLVHSLVVLYRLIEMS